MAKARTCDLLVEQLSAYLDGDLARRDCERVARHARRCPRCLALTAQLRATIGTCRRAAALPLPVGIRARARASIRALLEARAHPPRRGPQA